MLRNNFIIVTALVAMLTACGGGNSNDPTNPQTAPKSGNNSGAQPSTGPIDIGKLPLAQGLPTKYSRLQLVCNTHELAPIGGNADAWTESDSGRQVIWDLLTQPAPAKTITFTESSTRMQYRYDVALTVGLETGTYETNTEPGKIYQFHKAARLDGKITGKVTYADENGKIMFAETVSGTGSSLIMEENVGAQITDTGTEPDADKPGQKFHLTIKCTLEGDVKPPYAKDSTVLTN